ncbi:winged helix DNA-binding protein [Pararhodobacter oceanensis]|uniref:Transcriptional regulator n=1 Tax=Pararhodobacter oceanensis TaxID=2172121 RepID=A0A2T8HYA0_9RHOB|nr:winged helix DNA-binding protein [Pararhodobacter oceanensis]PVH30369.1 transcriptional regulator [Pararhodobacter oceanensis]
MSDPSRSFGPVVSSAHLAQASVPALSELEFAMTMANHAFQRWIVRCMAAAGAQMSPLEVMILHQVAHRNRPKTLADLCLVLNIEDTHLANYALRKLSAQGLVESERRGKEKAVRVTPEGAALCTRYREIREALLLPGLAGVDGAEMSRLAGLLRALSGSYDQAARSAAAL